MKLQIVGIYTTLSYSRWSNDVLIDVHKRFIISGSFLLLENSGYPTFGGLEILQSFARGDLLFIHLFEMHKGLNAVVSDGQLCWHLLQMTVVQYLCSISLDGLSSSGNCLLASKSRVFWGPFHDQSKILLSNLCFIIGKKGQLSNTELDENLMEYSEFYNW